MHWLAAIDTVFVGPRGTNRTSRGTPCLGYRESVYIRLCFEQFKETLQYSYSTSSTIIHLYSPDVLSGDRTHLTSFGRFPRKSKDVNTVRPQYVTQKHTIDISELRSFLTQPIVPPAGNWRCANLFSTNSTMSTPPPHKKDKRLGPMRTSSLEPFNDMSREDE